MNLYNDLQKDEQFKALYDNFVWVQIPETSPLVQNTWAQMKAHCGEDLLKQTQWDNDG